MSVVHAILALFIVKEDDGSTSRGDNKKIVSLLHIPLGIISSTRTQSYFEIRKCKMFFLLQFEFSWDSRALRAFELSPKNSSCGGKTAAYPEAYCKSLCHVTSRAASSFHLKTGLWSLTFFLKPIKLRARKNDGYCRILNDYLTQLRWPSG